MGKKVFHFSNLDAETLRISGADAEKFLQGMFTADLKRARSGAADHGGGGGTFLLDLKGKIVAPSKYFVFENTFYFLVPTGDGERVFQALEKLHISEDLQIENLGSTVPQKVAIGYSAPPLWSDLNQVSIPSPVPTAHDEVYQLVSEAWGKWLPAPEWGEGWVYLWIDDEKKFSESFELNLLSSPELELRRVQQGIPKWKVDYDQDSLVLEFPHAREISFHKGCYLGQEVVARASYRGSLPKALFRFQAETGKNLELGFVYNSFEPEKPVGKITSACQGWGLGPLRGSALSQGKLFQAGSSGQKILIEKAEALTRVRT
jgi:folate-binding protein YgfZ